MQPLLKSGTPYSDNDISSISNNQHQHQPYCYQVLGNYIYQPESHHSRMNIISKLQTSVNHERTWVQKSHALKNGRKCGFDFEEYLNRQLLCDKQNTIARVQCEIKRQRRGDRSMHGKSRCSVVLACSIVRA